jgi:hypothetical protein
MAAEATGQGLFTALILLASVMYLLFYAGRALYERIQLWAFISQDEDQADPLQILYLYKAKEVENQ